MVGDVPHPDQVVKGIGYPKVTLSSWDECGRWAHSIRQLEGGCPHSVLSCSWIQKSPAGGLGWWPRGVVWDSSLPTSSPSWASLLFASYRTLTFPVAQTVFSPILFPVSSISQLKWQTGLNGRLWQRWSGVSVPLNPLRPLESAPGYFSG